MSANLSTVGTPSFAAAKFGNGITCASGSYLAASVAGAFQVSDGSGYTLEYWFKSSTTTGYQIAFGRAGNEWWGLNAGKLSTSLTGITLPTTVVADGTWHHVAWTMTGTTVTCYLDGTSVASGSNTNNSSAWPTGSGNGTLITLGCWASNSAGSGANYYFLGQLDELRVSRGGRYTGTFTPSASAFSSDANTLGLYHLEADGTDAAASSSSLTNSVAPAVTPTSGVTTGSVLTTTNGTWSATPDSYTYQWNRAGVAISAATSSSYTVVGTDLSNAITCVVNAIKASYGNGTATSNSVTPTGGSSFTSSGTPTISGTTTVGQTLNAITGTWVPTPDSYTYQWNRSGSAIGGATSATYGLVAADAGATMTVTVTAVKSGYMSSAATSSSTATIAATVPGQPTGLAASAANTQSVLTWAAPSSNGGSAITDYFIEYQPSGGSWTTFTHSASTAVTATVTGLTNGTAYLFRVSAVNAQGTGSTSVTASATPSTASSTTITATDANIIYSPYNWNVSSSFAQTINCGATLRVMVVCTATTITAGVDTSSCDGARVIAVQVDAEPVAFTTLSATASSFSITIPSNGWSKHLIELTVVSITGNDLWNTPTSTFKWTGFSVATGTISTLTTRRRPYNILCYGDSITNGYATSSQFIIDGRLSWAYPLRQYLGAEVGVVGFNAQGFTHTGSANIPYFGSTYNMLWTGVSRSFTSPAEPNLIIINQGTNDAGTMGASTVTGVLNGMLAATTTTKIVVLQQWNGTGHRTEWQTAIAATTTPARITYVDTTGWWSSSDAGDGLHPYGYINLSDLSPRVATTVLPLLTGATVTTGNGGATVAPKRFLNKAGVAVAIQ